MSTAARGIYWLGYIISVILYTSYSATLVSQLAVKRPAPLPFNNLFELSKQSGWDAGCNNNDLFQVTASVGGAGEGDWQNLCCVIPLD